jgi:hypothetical protein
MKLQNALSGSSEWNWPWYSNLIRIKPPARQPHRRRPLCRDWCRGRVDFAHPEKISPWINLEHSGRPVTPPLTGDVSTRPSPACRRSLLLCHVVGHLTTSQSITIHRPSITWGLATTFATYRTHQWTLSPPAASSPWANCEPPPPESINWVHHQLRYVFKHLAHPSAPQILHQKASIW